MRANPEESGVREGGFTMIEILISILLLTIIMGGTLALQVASLRSSSDSQLSSAALVLAQTRLEQFRGGDYDPLSMVTATPEIACFRANGETLCDLPTTCVPNTGPCANAIFTRTTNVTSPGDRVIINVGLAWRTRDGLRTMGVAMERLP